MIKFSTDYHLGSSLKTHTTHHSRTALTEAIYQQALSVTKDNDYPHYIAGDLVDTYRNDEKTIQQTLNILSRVNSCLMGNHDVTNRVDSIGTMELLEPLTEVVPAVMGKCQPEFFTHKDEVTLCLVPHTDFQQKFEDTLKDLLDGEYNNEDEILVLHCNYELPWDSNETTLNLKEDLATSLLERFKFILIGHEHNHRTALGGRVILLGNIHPTNFSDISDKYSWVYEEGEMKKTLIWSKEKHYAEVKPFDETELGEDVRFVKVIGNVGAEEYPKYCRSLSKLWKNNPQAFAIKSAVEIINTNCAKKLDLEALENLTDTILSELSGNEPMRELFSKLLGELD